MSDDGPYYDAERKPNPVKWRPVKRRKQVKTDHGPIILYPDKHVELMDLINGHNWGNKAEDFIRRHKLKGEALEIFKRHFPDVKIPDED